MTLFAFEDFRCDIIRSSTDCSFALSIEFKFGCKTEVTNLDLHLVVQEQITELEISMNDTVAM